MIAEAASDTHLVGLGMPSVGAPVRDKENRALTQCLPAVLSLTIRTKLSYMLSYPTVG